jgi:hypothetical protein
MAIVAEALERMERVPAPPGFVRKVMGMIVPGEPALTPRQQGGRRSLLLIAGAAGVGVGLAVAVAVSRKLGGGPVEKMAAGHA